MSMSSSASSGDGAPAGDPLKDLYDRRQPYFLTALFGALAVGLLVIFGVSAVDPSLQIAFAFGLLVVAALAFVGGYYRGSPLVADMASGPNASSVGLASAAAGVALLNASPGVVAAVLAFLVPYVGWGSGRAGREVAKFSREIAAHGESGSNG